MIMGFWLLEQPKPHDHEDEGSGKCLIRPYSWCMRSNWAGWGPVTYTLKTDNSGNYQLWLNQGFNPRQVIAAKDGYQPIAKVARIIRGSSVTVNFALNKS